MRINNILNINYKNQNYQCSFRSLGSNYWRYSDCKGIWRQTQNTTSDRGDISLEDFAKIIEWRFRNCDKVNIMPMNVSDGTEAYMFANAIIRNEGLEKFKNKYSVKASDIRPDVIENYAKNGLLHLYNGEVSMFDRLGMDVLKEIDIKDYQDKIIYQREYPDKFYKLSDEYRQLFDFHVEDLQSRIVNLKDEGNSVIMIRNCLKQSFQIEAPILISKLKKKMRGASLLITGNYDRESASINEALEIWFVELMHNIWGLREYVDDLPKNLIENKCNTQDLNSALRVEKNLLSHLHK